MSKIYTVIMFVMNGKGGVGKSAISYSLCQFFVDRGFNVTAIEGDPVNLTLTTALGADNISNIQLVDPNNDSVIQEDAFNLILNSLDEFKKTGERNLLLVDIGSTYYESALDYMRQLDIEEAVRDDGAEFWVTTVAQMREGEKIPSQASIADICSTFNNVLVVENRFDGKSKDNFIVSDGNLDPLDVITIPRMHVNKINAFQSLMTNPKINNLREATVSPNVPASERMWIRKLASSYLDDDGFYGSSPVINRISTILAGKKVPDNNSFILERREAMGYSIKSEEVDLDE